MATRPNWQRCALLLFPLLSYGCAHQPVCPSVDRYPSAGADLLQPPPEPGAFRKELEAIIAKGRTSDPT